MDGDQRAGLRGYSAVGRGNGLVSIRERRGNHYVELKLSGRDQANPRRDAIADGLRPRMVMRT